MSWSTSDRKSRLPADWFQRKERVLRRDRRTCQIRGPRCLGRATEVDHIHPGDDHSEANLQAVCTKCHSAKSADEGHSKQAKLRALRKRPQERHPGVRTTDGLPRRKSP